MSTTKRVIIASVCIGLLVSFLHIFLCDDVYDDIAAYYGPITAAFIRGDWDTAFALEVPVLNTTMAGVLTLCGMHPFTALMVVSCFFYLAAIPLVYILVKHFLKRDDYAAWGVFIYIVAPKIIRFSCTGLLNSSRNFFVLFSAVMVLVSTSKAKWWKSVLLGIALAGAAMARAEAIIVAPLLTLWLGYYIFRQYEKKINIKSLSRILGHWIIVVATFLIFTSPFLYHMYKKTGYPGLDIRHAYTIASFTGAKLPQTNKTMGRSYHIKSERNAKIKRGWRSVQQGVECFFRGAYTPYFLLAIFGVIILYRKKSLPEADTLLLFSVVAVNSIVFFIISNSVRYFTITLIMLLPLTVAGIMYLWDNLPQLPGLLKRISIPEISVRHLQIVVTVGLAVIVLLQVLNGIAKLTRGNKYTYESNAGLWIKAHGNKYVKKAGRLTVAGAKPQYSFWADAHELGISSSRQGIEMYAKQIANEADFVVLKSKNKEGVEAIQEIGFAKTEEQPDKRVVIFYRKKESGQ